MYRDFQFYDSRIVDYTRIGETLTLFCVYGIHEKWRTCFYRVKDLVGEDFLVGSVISFFGYEHPGSGYTLFFPQLQQNCKRCHPRTLAKDPGLGRLTCFN